MKRPHCRFSSVHPNLENKQSLYFDILVYHPNVFYKYPSLGALEWCCNIYRHCRSCSSSFCARNPFGEVSSSLSSLLI